MVTYTLLMENKQIAFGVVGVLIGFVLGFFVSQAVQGPSAVMPPQAAPQTGASSQLPEGHPPVEQMEQLRQLEEHAEEHPEHVDVLIQLGNAYYDMKRFDAAIGWYEKAMALDPENVDVNNDLGTSYFATGDMLKSVSTLERSLELNADNPVALQKIWAGSIL